MTAKGNVTPSTTFLCELIEKTIRLALRAALPVWKITPDMVLHREGRGFSTAKILFEGIRLQFRARLNSIVIQHTIRIRAAMCPKIDTQKYKRDFGGQSDLN